MNKPKTKWWLRYSLRFSLVLITIFSVVLGLYIRYKKTRDNELAAIEKLEPRAYLFGYQLTKSSDSKPPGPKWIRLLLGDDNFFARVKELHLNRGSPFLNAVGPVTHLDGVEAFEELENLFVDSNIIEDVSAVLKLKHLRKLQLRGVTSSCDLTSIGKLSELESFSIRSQKDMNFSLETFRDHPSLESFSVDNWKYFIDVNVDALASIPNLKHLSFERCEIEAGSSNRPLPNLRSLTLRSSKGLESLGPLSSAPLLETLTLSHCVELNLSNSHCNYPRLKNLKIEACDAFTNLDGFENSKDLETASITLCPVENIEGLQGHDRLKTLGLFHLNKLESLDGMPLKSLEKCHIHYCKELKSIRAIAGASNLTDLLIDFCPQIKQVELHRNAKLERLHIFADVDGENLKQCLGASKKTLTYCWLGGCTELTDLDFLHDCAALKKLIVYNLDGLICIGSPKNESVFKLLKLELDSCENLKNLDGIEAFNTTHLTIRDCKDLEDASQIARLSKLKDLEVYDCKALKEISFVRKLPELKKATFSGTSASSKTAKQLATELSAQIRVW